MWTTVGWTRNVVTNSSSGGCVSCKCLVPAGKSTLTDSLVAAAGIIAMENVSFSQFASLTSMLYGHALGAIARVKLHEKKGCI